MKHMNDKRAEEIIGKLLRGGVLLAAFVVLLGGMLYLRQSAHSQSDYRTFLGVPAQLKTIPAVLRGAAGLNPEAIIQLGLLLLIATPIARVAFSIAAFALERDWLYVSLTFVVLGVLLYSLMQST
jgi:uncharacterized membrane protein